MNIRRNRHFHALPLYIGGDLDARERAEVEEAIASDPELAAEAERYARAREDLMVLRDLRADENGPESVWSAVRKRLRTETFSSLADDTAWWKRRSLRAGAVAALLLASFAVGFSLRDLAPATFDSGAPSPGLVRDETSPPVELDPDVLQEVDPGFRLPAPPVYPVAEEYEF